MSLSTQQQINVLKVELSIASSRLYVAVMALQAIELHHIDINSKAGRALDESRTLSIVRAALRQVTA